jgi:hypothetical protein
LTVAFLFMGKTNYLHHIFIRSAVMSLLDLPILSDVFPPGTTVSLVLPVKMRFLLLFFLLPTFLSPPFLASSDKTEALALADMGHRQDTCYSTNSTCGKNSICYLYSSIEKLHSTSPTLHRCGPVRHLAHYRL